MYQNNNNGGYLKMMKLELIGHTPRTGKVVAAAANSVIQRPVLPEFSMIWIVGKQGSS